MQVVLGKISPHENSRSDVVYVIAFFMLRTLTLPFGRRAAFPGTCGEERLMIPILSHQTVALALWL